MNVLVYDPFAGISGDMHIGAMIDLGVPEAYMIKSLESLHLHGWSLTCVKEQRRGITGTRALVSIEGHEHHHHEEHHHEHHHEHRTIIDIEKIVSSSDLNSAVQTLAMKIFHAVAAAEAKVHDKPIHEVHFHEVGAVDSIVDIVAAAVALDYLKPDRILSTAPELGGGFVTCAHGTIPVPAPATVEILQGIPTKSGKVNSETTTPTGAAILATVVDEFITTSHMRIEKIGYGVGTRDTTIPNVLRVYWAVIDDAEELVPGEDALMIECNIDDMNPELFSLMSDHLWDAGAKDVYMSSVMMKKGRLGTLLSVMTVHELRDKIYDILFTETTTAGVREYTVHQYMLERRMETSMTQFGEIRIKRFFYKGRQVSWKAEYDDVRELALAHGVPMKQIYEAISL